MLRHGVQRYFGGRMKDGKRVSNWLPTIVSLIAGAVTLIIYSVISEKKRPTMYLQIIAAACVPAVFPIIGKKTKNEPPAYLGWVTALHIFLANDLGSAMWFYGLIPAWDLIMHGMFGLVFSVIADYFIKRWGGGLLKKGGLYLLIFLSAAGAAALWEVWEFTCDNILGGDAQLVKAALAAGTNPISDTMTDIIITLVGAVVFIAADIIKNSRGKKRR